MNNMAKQFQVSSSPHIRSKVTTQKIMLCVILALLPAAIFGVWLNGLPAAIIICLSILTAVLTEFCYEKLLKLPVTVADGSAILTGLLLAMNLPAGVPYYLDKLIKK